LRALASSLGEGIGNVVDSVNLVDNFMENIKTVIIVVVCVIAEVVVIVIIVVII
jgi:hypothetical protein